MSSYLRMGSLRWSSNSKPTSRAKPLPPKVSNDPIPPSAQPDSWETVNPDSLSPVSADDNDPDFVSLQESSTDGGQDRPYLLQPSQQENAPPRTANLRGTHQNVSVDPQLNQGRAHYPPAERGKAALSPERGTTLRKEQLDVQQDALSRLQEENDQLKVIIRSHVKQIEDTERQRQVDVERLRTDKEHSERTAREEIERTKATLQQQARQTDAVIAERDRLRKDRDGVVASLSAENERLKTTAAKQAEEKRGALDELNRIRAQAHSDLQKARKNLDIRTSELQISLADNDLLLQENKDLRVKAALAVDLQRHLDSIERDLKAARDESSALRKEYAQMTALLDDRTSELKGAQSFLTTADTFSGTEVLNTLQKLNAEVLQNTAFMSESMIETFMSGKANPKTEEQTASAKRASGIVGRAMVHFLSTKKHKDDPILVQIAFQAYFSYVLQWIARAWIIGGDENQNRFIDGIYERVRDTEAQAIFGRWRALTRANIPQVAQLDELQLASLLTAKIFSGLADILLVAGCNASQSELVAALSAKFNEKVSFLVSLSMRINKIIGEDVTSGDLEILTVPPAATFDSSAMEDVYNEGTPGRPGVGTKVLCTTDLGLRKRVRVAVTGDKEKHWAITTLLKPKVALESVVDIMED
ncbi:hypothetical protein ID866_7666 [Astraeus odoratus]|nr:hypothetical protein ID866_7666 [Astraeus odoratus]